MAKEPSFFETNLRPLVQEIEQASQALNSVCEEVEEGMCFLLKGTLDRIAKDINQKIVVWDRDFDVQKK